MGKPRMSTKCQICFTVVYGLVWALMGVGLLLYHVSIAQVVPALANFPDNLAAGFNIVLGFDNLEGETVNIKTAVTSAVALCGITATPCPTPIPDPVPLTLKSTSTTQLAAIDAAFGAVLDSILKVCTDPYFGVDDLADTATGLQNIKDEIANLEVDDKECIGTNQVYCSIYTNAESVNSAVGPAKDAINAFTGGDLVKEFKENVDYLNLLHTLPYVLVISALFFHFFWWKYATCCCCAGGGCGGFLLLIAFFLFWVASFAINTVVLALCIFVKFGQDRIPVDFLKGKPTLEVLLVHVKTQYPKFWEKVFADMETGLDFFYHAVSCFEVFAVILMIYGLCMCCARPYNTRDQAKIVAIG